MAVDMYIRRKTPITLDEWQRAIELDRDFEIITKKLTIRAPWGKETLKPDPHVAVWVDYPEGPYLLQLMPRGHAIARWDPTAYPAVKRIAKTLKAQVLDDDDTPITDLVIKKYLLQMEEHLSPGASIDDSFLREPTKNANAKPSHRKKAQKRR